MKYSPERREAILAKLEAPYNRTVNDLAGEEGISSTLNNARSQWWRGFQGNFGGLDLQDLR